MTITEAINGIKADGGYNTANVYQLEEAVMGADIKSFTDPSLKEFIDFINDEPYDEKIQGVVDKLVNKLASMGVLSPCAGGCGPECAFHESEFGG